MKTQHKSPVVRGAFTLIEILVVLVIMGFLVAMVAPKLSGIIDTAVDTTCDTNQERLRKIVNGTYAINGTMPSGMTNMVTLAATTPATNIPATDADVQVPLVSDGDKTNGAEFLSEEFVERFAPKVHFINADEADELKGFGIKAVKALNKVTALNVGNVDAAGNSNIIETGLRQNVVAGLPVMMVGVGVNQAGNTAAWSTGKTVSVTGSAVTVSDTLLDPIAATATNAQTATVQTYSLIPEGKLIGRIVLGVGNDSEMVQSGILDESGTCPGAIQNKDNHTWGNYMVVLPRLQSTIDRLDTTSGTAVATGAAAGWNLHAVSLTEEDNGAFKISGRTPGTGFEHFGAQPTMEFTTSCPEGHTWGTNADFFGVSVK